jgi:hypothetical protein
MGLVEDCNLFLALCPIWQKLFYHLNLGIHLAITLALSSGHDQLGGLIAESSSLPKKCELSAQPHAFIHVYARHETV